MEEKENKIISEKHKRSLLSLLFSSLGLVIIVMIIELVLLFLAYKKLFNYLIPTFGVILIIDVLTLSNMLYNQNVNFEMRITWTVIIVGLPLIGSLIYLFINLDALNHKYKKDVFVIETETNDKLKVDQEVVEQIQDNDELRQLHTYLSLSGNKGIYKNCYLKYFPSGEDAFEVMKEELKKAKKCIYLEYFIIDNGIMWDQILDILLEKVNEGIDVKILYDGTCDFAKVPPNFYKKMQKLNIRCHKFAPLLPLISPYYNYRDHRKFMIIDGATCFTGGINVADEYINAIEVYGYWKDTVIMVKGEAVKSYTLMFLQLFSLFEKQTDFSLLEQDLPKYETKGYVIPYGDVPFDKYSVGKYVYMDIINHAKDYVYIMTPYFITDSELFNCITNAALRGVDVRIILPGIPDKRIVKEFAESRYKALLDNQVKIYEYTPGFNHAKMMISDDIKAVVGTINMDYRSLYHHYEDALYMYDCDEIKEIKKDFIDTIEKSQLVDKNKKLNRFYQFIVKLVKFLEPLI